MEILTLADCETTLRTSVSNEDILKILDSLIYHLQAGKDEVDKVAQLIGDMKEPLFKRVEALEKELEEMKRERKETKQELEEIKRKWESLKTLEDSLLMGQLAFILEKEIVKKILEGTRISPRHVTITQISNALANENDRILPLTQEQKDIIIAKWNRVQREYQLEGGLYRIISAFKKDRNTEAHPSIKNISTRLSDKVSQEDKEDVKKMLEILEKIQM